MAVPGRVGDMMASQTSQILFCGDVHGNFSHIIDAVTELAPAAVVLLCKPLGAAPAER